MGESVGLSMLVCSPVQALVRASGQSSQMVWRCECKVYKQNRNFLCEQT